MLHKLMTVLAVSLIVCTLVMGNVFAATLPPQQIPQLVTMTSSGLIATRTALLAGNATATSNLTQLQTTANTELTDPISTVTAKTALLKQSGMLSSLDLPSNFSPHEYLSLNTYLANGQRNPNDSEIPDITYLQGSSTSPGLIKDAMNLSVAYYLTGNKAYATQAAAWLRAWFVTPATSMSPNLTYAQLKVGDATGQGIIDSHNLPDVLDAVSLISGSGALTKSEQQTIQSWFSQYLTWLTTSTQGTTEGNTSMYFNNRASWYRAQVVAIADYLGKTSMAKTYALQGEALINHQIAANGTQPEELIRGQEGEDPWNYSYLNLQALIQLAIASQLVNVDLFHYVNPNGASIETALDMLLPYDLGTQAWPGTLTFVSPQNGQVLPVTQSVTPQMSLLNLPEAVLARVYTTDTAVQVARTKIQPAPIARLEFPSL